MGFRIDIVTASISDAVRHAGGLMFDRSRAGWQVRVLTDDTAHERALTILGAQALPSSCPEDTPRVSDRVACLAATETALPDRPGVLLWRRPAPGDSVHGAEVRHHLSSAAAVFKAQALRSVGLGLGVGAFEDFWVGGRFDADLFEHLMPGVQQPLPAEVVGGWPHG